MGEAYQRNGIDDVTRSSRTGDAAIFALEKCAFRPSPVLRAGQCHVRWRGWRGCRGFAQTVGDGEPSVTGRRGCWRIKAGLRRRRSRHLSSCSICVVVAIAIKLDRGRYSLAQSRRATAAAPHPRFRSMSVMEDGGNVRQATQRSPGHPGWRLHPLDQSSTNCRSLERPTRRPVRCRTAPTCHGARRQHGADCPVRVAPAR